MRRAILTEKRFGFTKEMIVGDNEYIIRVPVQTIITLKEIDKLSSPTEMVSFEYICTDEHGVYIYREAHLEEK